MRILHTSDWHLGRSFHGEDLLAVQAAFVDHLIETVETEQVDLVVVAGDVYDRASRPSTRWPSPTTPSPGWRPRAPGS